MSYPRRADHFREWSKLMLEQALVPERVQYKGSSSTKSVKGMNRRFRKRRKRNLRRLRRSKQDG